MNNSNVNNENPERPICFDNNSVNKPDISNNLCKENNNNVSLCSYGNTNNSPYPYGTNFSSYNMNPIEYSSMIINNLICENRGLGYELNRANTDLWKLENKIKKLCDKNKYAREELTAKNGNLFCLKGKEGFDQRLSLYAEFDITDIYIIDYDKKYRKDNKVKEYLIKLSTGRYFILSESDFRPTKIIKIFQADGISFVMSASAEKMGFLLLNYIAEKIRNNQIGVLTPYYCSGWYKRDKWTYQVLYRKPVKELAFNMSNTNYIANSGTNEPVQSCSYYLDLYKSVFNNPEQRAVMLSLLCGAVLYTRFKSEGLNFNSMVFISGNKRYINKIVSMFLKVFEKDSGNMNLKTQTRYLYSLICDTKDCPVIIDARGCSVSNRLVLKNINELENIFCRGNTFDIKDCDSIASEAVPIIIDEQISYFVDENMKLCIDFNDEDIEEDRLLSLTDFDSERFGDFLKFMIMYFEDNPIDENIVSRKDIPDFIDVSQREVFIFLRAGIRACRKFLKSYRLEGKLDYVLEGTGEDSLKGFFSSELYEPKSVCDLFIKTLKELISNKKIMLKTDNLVNSDEEMNSLIFAVNNEILIARSVIKDVILPHMRLNIKVINFLRYLNEAGVLLPDKECMERKRIICVGNENRQIRLVVLKNLFFETMKEYTEEEKKNEKKLFNWDF